MNLLNCPNVRYQARIEKTLRIKDVVAECSIRPTEILASIIIKEYYAVHFIHIISIRKT